MQNRLEASLRGYLLLSIKGKSVQRFLQLCAFHGLTFWNLIWTEGGYEAFLSVRDFRRLIPICRKTGTKIHILEKHGLPFFFEKNRKRKAFFLGFLIFAGLLYGFSGRIWQIQVTGNYSNSTPAILGYLGEMDVLLGTAKDQLDCSEISAAIRGEFSNVTWVSTKIDGTKLKITVKENDILYGTETEEEKPCDLVAAHSGTILSMITRQGTPLKKAGDPCEKGEILVSGRVEIKNDNQEPIRYEYVKADADIIVEYKLQYRDQFPTKYTQRVYDEKEKVVYAVRVGDLRIGSKGRKAESNQDVIREQFVWQFSKGLGCPVILEKERLRQYEKKVKTYSQEEAQEKASKRLQTVIENFLEKGVEISQNNVKISVDENSCVSEGILVVQGEAGQMKLIEEFTQPEERELADEQ